jgi:hypothetical protein
MRNRGARAGAALFGIVTLSACGIGAGAAGADASLAAHRSGTAAPSLSAIALQQPQMAPICGASMAASRAGLALSAMHRARGRNPRV